MENQVTVAAEDKTALLLEVHRRLTEVYGQGIKYFHDLDPLSELVSSLLSHRTRNSQSAKAYHQLRRTFGTWEAVMAAPTLEVQEAISPCTWPEQKAPRLQLILRLIAEKQGSLSLDFIEHIPVSEAREWLESLPGVGPKTSAAVISFSSLRGKALPVDSHHFRVVVRLGIIPERIGEARAHHILESMLPENFTAQEMYDHHQVIMKHGQNVCSYRNPACAQCVLLDLCPTGKEVLAVRSSTP